MAIDMAEKTAKKVTGAKDRKKPVKIIVKPVYTGKQDMSEDYGQ